MRHSSATEPLPGGAVEQKDGPPAAIFRADVEAATGCDRGVLAPHERHILEVHVADRHFTVHDEQHVDPLGQHPPHDAVVGQHDAVLVHADREIGVQGLALVLKLTGQLPHSRDIGQRRALDVHQMYIPTTVTDFCDAESAEPPGPVRKYHPTENCLEAGMLLAPSGDAMDP